MWLLVGMVAVPVLTFALAVVWLHWRVRAWLG